MVKTAKSVKITSSKVPLYNLKAEKIKDITLPAAFFNAKINDNLIAQAIKIYLHNQRAAHAVVKHRGEIAGTTKKMYSQKGTGQARHSTAKAPQFVGGGSANGPRGDQKTPMRLSQKLRQSALKSILSKFTEDKSIIVIDKLSTIEPKTKSASVFIGKLEKQIESLANSRKIGIITSRHFDSVKRAFGNIPDIKLISVKSLNSYDLSRQNYLIFTAAALKQLSK
ncbi:MAG TPA: 50S ribosomal protein L4 [Candidatus Woesebacteria bacterium]|nr:50S ribosomal protein L4 [Candidatus Woesebacteria bacterium]HPR99226.1 50S ribosomal protein L4 [Candidatus Woesebacteria bacterium]